MRVSSSPLTPIPAPATPPRPAGETTTSAGVTAPAQADRARYSVLNDLRYLTDSDADLLRAATGRPVSPDLTAGHGPASAFAQQLALDRRIGALAPSQDVTAVHLRNAAAAIEQVNAGRAGARNPYAGPVFERAVAYLEATGRGRADVRL